jgi:hypothetical protein
LITAVCGELPPEVVIEVAAPAVLVRVNCAGGPTEDAVTWKEPALVFAVTVTDASPLASVALVAAESVPPGAVVVSLAAHPTVIFAQITSSVLTITASGLALVFTATVVSLGVIEVGDRILGQLAELPELVRAELTAWMVCEPG